MVCVARSDVTTHRYLSNVGFAYNSNNNAVEYDDSVKSSNHITYGHMA